MQDFDYFLIWCVWGLVVLVGYRMFLERKASPLDRKIRRLRRKPRVITEVGICIPIKTIPLSDGKYMVKYDHPTGYCPTYRKTATQDDIVPLDVHQTMWGSTAPLFIERKLIMNLAYNHEHAPTREYMKTLLAQSVENISKTDMTEAQKKESLAKLMQAVNVLADAPQVFTETQYETGRQQVLATKYQSDLLAERSGTQGEIDRRIQPFIEVAGRAAQRPDTRSTNTQ